MTMTLGATHTCGLTSDGTGYCWGDASFGKLGIGPWTTHLFQPTSVLGNHRFVSIDAGAQSTCAVTDENEILCWGELGPAGLPLPGTQTCQRETKGATISITCSLAPLRMPHDGTGPDTTFARVAGQCALTTLGSVFCYASQQGHFLSMVGFGPFVALAGGRAHTCGLDGAGAAWCWGANDNGQLGDGTTDMRQAPVLVAGGHSFVQLAAGDDHTCGLTVGGEAWCWGQNNVGQTGLPILSNTRLPRKVRGQG
jgi:alpha-tubulin suppressor-like RCC1 family protein